MTRVLMVLDELLVGGTETHVLSLSEALLKRKQHVVVCGADGPLREKFEALGCPVYRLSNGYPRDHLERKTLRAELRAIIKREKITVVHTHQGSTGVVAAQLAAKSHIPVVFTVHGMIYGTQAIQTIARESAAVVSVSPPIQTELQKLAIPSVVIANGVDTHRYHRRRHHRPIRAALGIPPRGKVVLYAGRLSWEKAWICRRVIWSCAQLRTRFPNLHLVIAGDGFHFDDVKTAATRAEAQHHAHFIHCVGERSDMTDLYAVADCVVGTGRVALEAMASGRPVVAAGTQGFFGLVTEQRMDEAWQYYYGDHKSCRPWLAKYIKPDLVRALSSQATAHRCADAGRDFVKRKFAVEQVAARTMGVYRRVRKNSRMKG